MPACGRTTAEPPWKRSAQSAAASPKAKRVAKSASIGAAIIKSGSHPRLGHGVLVNASGQIRGQLREPKISDITSERVASRSLKAPLIALVTNVLADFSTPRIVMQL